MLKNRGTYNLGGEDQKFFWIKSTQESKITKSKAATKLCRLHTASPHSPSTQGLYSKRG
jgi:hypothetical protein